MDDPKPVAVGEDDPAFDDADALEAEHQDWDQLDSLFVQMVEVGDDKAAAKALYGRLAGS